MRRLPQWRDGGGREGRKLQVGPVGLGKARHTKQVERPAEAENVFVREREVLAQRGEDGVVHAVLDL
jgi:hypothetical protein